MTKIVFFLLALAFGSTASATIQCAGETYNGTIVTVDLRTVGAVGAPADGRVSIYPYTGGTKSYTLERNEIVQFFEDIVGTRAYVGLAAYELTNNPVKVRYVGRNYSGNLVTVLRNPNRARVAGNEMRVWRGSPYAGNEQYRFQDVVCKVFLDP